MKLPDDIREFLRESREAGHVSLTRLDRFLSDDAVFGPALARLVAALGELPLADDRTLDAGESAGFDVVPATALPLPAHSHRPLVAEEEIRLSKRIEFARLRIEVTANASSLPDWRRRHYLSAVDAEEARVPAEAGDWRPDEDAVHARFTEFLAQRNELVERNLLLVERLAARYRTYGIPGPDLVQHGNLGLIRAADKFDWRKQVRFRTYAEWWIRQAIERATDTDRDVIHVPRPVRQKMSRAQHVHRASGVERPLDASRFAELSGLDRAAAARVFSIKTGVASLDQTALQDGRPMKDDLEGPDLGRRGEREALEHLRVKLRGMIDDLPERERLVLRLRFGLDGATPQTLEEVGAQLSISRERVRQLQMRALDHLREASPDPRAGTI